VRAAAGVARSYAKALFELARERNQLDTVAAEIESLATLLRDEAELRAFFARPWIAAVTKRTVAAEIATRMQLSQLTRDFLALVAARGRTEHLAAIVEAFRGLQEDAAGRVRARVRTAVALSDSERAALTGRLGRALGGKQIVLEEVVDRGLLGGFVAEIGSLLVDGSLDGQLARMRERLVKG
jgi:F-type H+-transporting ATPase subunit delta